MSLRRVGAMCFAVLLFVTSIVMMPSCSSHQQAISGENIPMVQGMTVNLVESWEPSSGATSASTTYTNSFGVITAGYQDASNGHSCEEYFNEFLDGIVKGGSDTQIERDKTETLDTFGDAIAYRVPFGMTVNGSTAHGYILCVFSGTKCFALMVGNRDESHVDTDTPIKVIDSARITPLEKPAIPVTASEASQLESKRQQEKAKEEADRAAEEQRQLEAMKEAEKERIRQEEELRQRRLHPIEFGEGTFDSNSSYKRYVGTVTNVSDETHYFIKIRGTFTDDAGNAIDTDWTYACGDEGLKPGESTKFTLSVPHDQRITRVHYEIYDYR